LARPLSQQKFQRQGIGGVAAIGQTDIISAVFGIAKQRLKKFVSTLRWKKDPQRLWSKNFGQGIHDFRIEEKKKARLIRRDE
jgi:hypothetical protein